MKRAFLVLAALAALAATAEDDRALGTNITITSEITTERAWARRVVMQDEEGGFLNDGGTVGDAATAAANGAAATAAAAICEASNTAMTNAMSSLDAASASAATDALSLALVVAPDAARSNLTAYVVKTATDGTNDTQWVWYNREISCAPNRFVAYETYDKAATNKVVWTDWTNAVTVVQNGRTWEGCHVCTVTRPTWAVGVPCLDIKNDIFGGPAGFDFGDVLLTCNGVPLYTGMITNAATGQVAYFDNGFFKGFITEGE